jgi:hypothetical protein
MGSLLELAREALGKPGPLNLLLRSRGAPERALCSRLGGLVGEVEDASEDAAGKKHEEDEQTPALHPSD